MNKGFVFLNKFSIYHCMKILVFGAGVIGTTYAWQMWEAGHEVSLLVRRQRLVRYSHSGVTITCTDVRGKEKEYKKTVFRPKTTDRLEPKDNFDLIIVAIKNFQLGDALPHIAKFSGNAHILFLGHLWNEFSMIEKHLPKGRYFFGLPAMVLGSQTLGGINCYLFGDNHTYLGEPDGKTSKRLQDLAAILESSGLQPKIIPSIEPMIRGHFAWQAAMLGPVIKAGSFRLFAENNKLIAQSLHCIKEVLSFSRKGGLKADSIFPFWMQLIPVFIAAPFLKKSLNPTMQAALEARLKYGFEEIKMQFQELIKLGTKTGEDMLHLKSFEKYMPEGEKKYLQQ